ncbi:neurogenic locus notch homolog protein 4-like [Penaeus vannamei]|uniref:neurogenic locus notch homolog protein 4-like n=1 Tax=Penaeus vannamei TaxID=6689 RepID=UPI00387F8C67
MTIVQMTKSAWMGPPSPGYTQWGKIRMTGTLMMMMAAGTSRGVQITAGRASNTGLQVAPIADHRTLQHDDPSGMRTLLRSDPSNLFCFAFSTFPVPSLLLPVAPIAVYPETQGRVTTPLRQNSFADRPFVNRQTSQDPCRPSPCGPNTRCEVSPRGIALCRCLADFVPDGNTINGCKPQCTRDDECPDDYRCRSTKCVRVCVQGACGINAECDSRNHRAVCNCPSNYRGDPHIRCNREEPDVRVAPPAPPLDPCQPSPCGINADCTVRGDRPVCTCPIGYEGDPLSNCRRGECIEANDCPGHLTCQRLKCIDPCGVGVCGQGSECTVRNHQPICSCPRGFVGDPFNRCRRFDPQELCSPSPCGRNTNCKVRNDRAVCSCIDNYIGNPLTGCEPECVRDTDCPNNMACRQNICVNPCRDACGEGAYCEVRNSRAVCSCPQYYQGDPYSRCYAECTAHDDCPNYQACYQLQCVNPCDGACGTGADCKVEDHKPICSCPRGYTGHPFEACRPFTSADLCNPNPCGSQADCTPGFDSSGNDRPVCTCPTGFIGNPLVSCQRGECQGHNECPNHQACYAYQCQNPCYYNGESVCGRNADCTVKNHQPVCSCPQGYDGNPLSDCTIGRGGGFVVGRNRK